MIDVICIKDIYLAKQGEIYHTDDDYNITKNGSDIWIYREEGESNKYKYLGVYPKYYFITLAEYREQQIKSVLDE